MLLHQINSRREALFVRHGDVMPGYG
jgi:hypothetical protein